MMAGPKGIDSSTGGGPITSAEEIMEIADGFRASRILLSAFELDVFSAIDDGSLTSAEVAGRIGADRRAADRLLNALSAIGLLLKEEGTFRNGPAAARFLVRKSPDALTNLGHTSNLYHSWASLSEAVRAGTMVVEREQGEDDVAVFIAAMHRRAAADADALAARLDRPDLGRLLDVGGGSGVYAMALCRARAELTAVILDRPQVIELTRRYVASVGLSERITLVDGDYLESDFGEGFDLVFMSAIVHINSAEENRHLMKKAVAALNPGGRVAIVDYVMDENRTDPPAGAVFALNMLVNTRAGDTYTEAEMSDWLIEAGCGRVDRIDMVPAKAILIGNKPGTEGSVRMTPAG